KKKPRSYSTPNKLFDRFISIFKKRSSKEEPGEFQELNEHDGHHYQEHDHQKSSTSNSDQLDDSNLSQTKFSSSSLSSIYSPSNSQSKRFIYVISSDVS